MTGEARPGDVRVRSDGTATGTAVEAWTGDAWVLVRGLRSVSWRLSVNGFPLPTVVLEFAAHVPADLVAAREEVLTLIEGGGGDDGERVD